MAIDLLNLGTTANDGTGDSGRDGGIKINAMFTELYETRAQIIRIAVTTPTRNLLDSELVVGHNIIGVNYAGDVAITVPAGLAVNKLIVINDESGAAGTYNITVTVA